MQGKGNEAKLTQNESVYNSQISRRVLIHNLIHLLREDLVAVREASESISVLNSLRCG